MACSPKYSVFNGALLLALLTLGAFRVGAIPTVEESAKNESNRLVERERASEKKSLGALVWSMVEADDLSNRAKSAINALADDTQFEEFLEKRRIDPEAISPKQMVRHEIEYWRNSKKLPSQVIAWIGMVSDLDAPWFDSMSHFRELEKYRSKYFVPGLLMLRRPVSSADDCRIWMKLVQQTYAYATNAQQRGAVLLMALNGAPSLGNFKEGNEPLVEFGHWIDYLKKSEPPEKLSTLTDMQSIQILAGLARNDYAAVAEFAKGSKLRSLRPLWLMMAGKPEQAPKAIEELLNAADLSEEEKNNLQNAEGILKGISDAKKLRDVK